MTPKIRIGSKKESTKPDPNRPIKEVLLYVSKTANKQRVKNHRGVVWLPRKVRKHNNI